MHYRDVKIGDLTVSFPTFIFGTHHFGLDRLKFVSDLSTSRQLLEQYTAGGGTVIDTARAYGRSEEYIGKCFEAEPSLRKALTVISKGGQGERLENGRLIVQAKLDEKSLRADLMQSLELLRVDCIDLYLLHKDDPTYPTEEVIETLESFRRQGYIRAYGASNWTTARINAANTYAAEHGYSGFSASELAFSPYVGSTAGWGKAELCVEMDRMEYEGYRQNGVPVLAYNSQANGFFYKNFDKPDCELKGSEANLQKLRLLRSICHERGITPQQAIFGFFAGLDITAVPVATTTSPQHLREMLDSCDTVLDAQEVQTLLL